MTQSAALFSGPAPRVRTAPAGTDATALLARALRDELHDPADPFRLADAIVLLPNRRSVGALINAFHATGAPTLLPAIRPLGDLDDAPEVWGAGGLDLDVAPAIDPLRRRLELARLVAARDRAEGGVDDPLQALACADDLCRLLDSAAAGAETVDWGRLDALVSDHRFAAHWSRAVSFLSIVTRHWPTRLAEDGLCDPAERRNRLLLKLAAQWRAEQPPHPVLIAGSTGSVAATRALMQVVAALPQGCVVLPGLDAELDDDAWSSVDPQHPQFALKHTLEALGVPRDAVPWLPGANETPAAAARRTLIREALVPADSTADWLQRLRRAGGQSMAANAVSGLRLLECASPDAEAAAIALLLREALETPGRRAALVTPDAELGARVEAKLNRWGVEIGRSEGLRLAETRRGRLALTLLELADDPGEPLALASLLSHGLARFDLAPAALDPARARWLQALRGPRCHRTMAALANALPDTPLTGRLLALANIFEQPLDQRRDLSTLAEQLASGLELVCGRAAFDDADSAALADLLRSMIAHGAAMGDVAPQHATRVLSALVEAQACPPDARIGRVAVLGPFEARLSTPDLVILGGLNERTWPAPPPEDGFLNRAMRAELGLPAPEVRLGLAAHDFAQLACAPEVVFTRARRAGGTTQVASRWLWRLTTLLAGAKAPSLDPSPDVDPRIWANRLDDAARFQPAKPPEPRPPPSARPASISFSRVETLIRDPYAFYAARVLGLQPLDLPGREPDQRERGAAVHNALQRLEGSEAASPEVLLALLDQELAAAGFSALRRQEEQARLRRAVERWCAWRAERAGHRVLPEVNGETMLGPVRLYGRADRIELWPGGAEVIDVKTGSPPSVKQVMSGLAPQLTLEAAVLNRGGFEGAPAATATALTYWRFGGGKPGPVTLRFKDSSSSEQAEEALAKLKQLLARYADPTLAYRSKPRAQFLTDHGDYDQLARRREWSEGEE